MRTRTPPRKLPPEGGAGVLPLVPGVAFRLIADPTGYAVGDDGTVWSSHAKSRARLPGWWRVSLQRRQYGAGYTVCCLRADGGRGKVLTRYVHRLVLEAFAGPCPAGMQCRHLDGDPANNRLGNLCWGTPAENTLDKIRHGRVATGANSPNAIFGEREIVASFLLAAAGLTHTQIATALGTNQSTISSIIRGETYSVESAAVRQAYEWLRGFGFVAESARHSGDSLLALAEHGEFDGEPVEP